jgi:predicted metal-dependent HD superfamily phosphohydrolase
MAAVTSLVDQWVAAAEGAGATAEYHDVRAAGELLLGWWSRRGVGRLTAVLGVVDEFAGLAAHPDRVRLAAWLHDTAYGRVNGQDSAEFALGLLTMLGVPGESAAEVARLVGLTAGHATEEIDPDGELLCDADLAVLGSDAERYDAHTAALREDYAHVPEGAFRAARAQVLVSLLELPAIYRNEPLRERWEAKARENLERELRALAAKG